MTFMAQRVAQFATTIFTEMTALAIEHKAVNLGQGFPDFEAPDFIKKAAREAIAADINQYAPLSGRPDLRQVIARQASRAEGREIDPNREVAVMVGATEGIFATIMGLVNPGDEVIIFEPYYDSYVPTVQWAGGIPRYYTLEAPDWAIDPDRLRTLFSPKTRMILINTPHNPTGKVFSKDELEMIAGLCQEFDAIAMVDAVYEHIVFDGSNHLSMSTIPGMADRTVSISSLGKTFSVTGWKTGWTIAAPELTQAILRAYQFVTFSGIHPFQAAAAQALLEAEKRSYYTELAAMYTRKRDILLPILEDVGLPPLTPQGTYFVMVDISHLDFANDVAFCKYLTREVGVAAIPPSAFYHDPAAGAGLARFTFCKRDEVLEEAGRRLQLMKH
ncbi:MAG: methionine aminotransferase [Ardenticatenaceae bacterium]|nr:methionine aminotransferase [Ardenticatenaceae bacterium]